MKHLIKQYIEGGLSRRGFLSGLGAVGLSTVAANSMARSLAPFLPEAEDSRADGSPAWMREMRGQGGALLVAQLKAAGIEHIFFNPSSGEAPIFDALVDEPQMHLIQALQEGALVAMADGYAKASGKPGFVICARPGFPNAMTQLFNTWKDQIPVLVAVDYVDRESMGQDAFEDADHMDNMAGPITKWHWVAQTTEKIPEIARRALKFATTSPCGPVFLAFPEDTLHEEAKASIMDQSKFNVSMKIRPDAKLVEQTARLLLEARNPLIYAGDEVVWCGAQKEIVELAEMLGVPVSRNGGNIGWSKPFPTAHALYVGGYQPEMRYPGEPDVLLNLGSRMPYAGAQLKMSTKTKLVQMRLDPANMAREYPTEIALASDLKLGIADLVAALGSMATAERLQQMRKQRMMQTQQYTAKMREYRNSIAHGKWDRSPISIERLGAELEQGMDKDTCFVAELDSGRKMENLMAFGGADKQYFGTTGAALGWGVPAAFGVKLARPDLPVVAVVGDGAFLFSGLQPLWSSARYRAPVTIVVMNNRSYNNERNRIWFTGGKQFQVGRDMTCYLGDPDIDFAKAASAFGVEGEVVATPEAFRPALDRAKRANVEGRPYLLDVHVDRDGIGAASTWHPSYTIDSLRKRKV